MVDSDVSETRVVLGSLYAIGGGIMAVLGMGFAEMGFASTQLIAYIFGFLLVLGSLELSGALPDRLQRQIEKVRGVFYRGGADA